ncbi:MAG: alpha/beta fold hydrolase [Clostridium sp.]
MKLLPESNGLYRVNMKKKLKPFDIFKITAISIVGLLLVGFLYQSISDFAIKEKLKYRYDYTRVNDKLMDYYMSGSGDYTVIFDGNIGGDLSQWTSIVEELNKNSVRTFVYNRQGYGYSEDGTALSPKEQAENLKILLRKAGISGEFILVGEGYGSLVMTNFAKEYPDSVAGMVLVNPINEESIGSKEIKDEYKITKIRRKIEAIGSSFGLTNILDKLNLTVELDDYEKKIPEIFQEEFIAHRTMSNYTNAVYNEIDNLVSGTSESQEENLLNGKPLYLITNDKEDPVKKIGSESNTYIYETESTSKFMALDDSDAIITGITHLTKELKMSNRAR